MDSGNLFFLSGNIQVLLDYFRGLADDLKHFVYPWKMIYNYLEKVRNQEQ